MLKLFQNTQYTSEVEFIKLSGEWGLVYKHVGVIVKHICDFQLISEVAELSKTPFNFRVCYFYSDDVIDTVLTNIRSCFAGETVSLRQYCERIGCSILDVLIPVILHITLDVVIQLVGFREL